MMLTVEVIGYFKSKGAIMKDDITYAEITVVNPKIGGMYTLIPGQYLIKFKEMISIPEGLTGVITNLSHVIRNGAVISSVVLEEGSYGQLTALLVVHNPMGLNLQKGAALATLLVGGEIK